MLTLTLLSVSSYNALRMFAIHLILSNPNLRHPNSNTDENPITADSLVFDINDLDVNATLFTTNTNERRIHEKMSKYINHYHRTLNNLKSNLNEIELEMLEKFNLNSPTFEEVEAEYYDKMRPYENLVIINGKTQNTASMNRLVDRTFKRK